MNAMNITNHHPKVGLSLAVAGGPFIAGGEVRGKFTVESRTERGLGLGTISVELVATQELTSRDHAATTTFIQSRRFFQGPGLPISNAVLPEPPRDACPLPREYHHAQKGQTSFFFQFPLPSFAPSTINFGHGLARTRYEVSALIEVFWKDEKRVVAAQKSIEVLETLPQLREPPATVIVAEGGKIHINAFVMGPFVVLGRTACVQLTVKNHSRKKTSGINLTLNRKLHLRHGLTQKQPIHISDTVTSVPFNGPEYSIPPGGEGTAHLVFELPRDGFGSGLSTRDQEEYPRKGVPALLFGVECEVEVTIGMGLTNPGIVFSIPITIAHPETLPLEPIPPPGGMSPPPISYGHMPYASPLPWGNGDYLPLDPPRPLYAEPAVSTPPSPQFVPYASPHLPGAISLPQMPAGPNPYFPHYASQPTTPQQGNYPFLPAAQYTTPPPQMYPPNIHPHFTGIMHASPEPSCAPAATSIRPLPDPLLATRTGLIVRNAKEVPQIQPRPRDRTDDTESVVGKGVQAARVAHHLRQTSRTRSASPTPHRFVLPPPLQPSAEITVAPQPLESPTRLQLLSPTLSSNGVLGSPTNREIATGLTQPAGLHSPRPHLSPRLSFDERSTPQGVKVPTLKSKPVEDLERMAEEVLRESKPPEGEIAVTSSRKTLPKIPESKSRNEHPAVAPKVVEAHKGAPPTKPLSSTIVLHNVPARPLPSEPKDAGEREAALDALERRLAGPSWEKMDAAERWLVASRRDTELKAEGTARPRPRREPSGPRNENVRMADGREPSRERESRQSRRESGLPPMPVPEPIEPPKDNSSSHEQEIYKLQREAVSRVGQWAAAVSPTIEPDAKAWTTLTSQIIPKRSSGFVNTKPGFATEVRPPLKELFEPPDGGRPDAFLVDANVVSTNQPLESTIPSIPTPVRPEKTFQLRASPLLVPSHSYDVRSARGGKGGLVTSVAALWERGPGEPSTAVASPPAPPSLPVFKVPGLPASATHPRTSPLAGNASKKPDSSRASPAFRPSVSDPVINGTIAKPYLSSAASLVNPARNPPAAKVSLIPKSPPTDARKCLSPPRLVVPVPSSPPIAAAGVGQARLRDLIAKYQNPA